MKPEDEDYKRGERGRFAPGTKAGPGRPPGVPELKRAMRELWKQNADDYAEKLDAMIKDGDPTAWKLMMERGDPVTKEVDHVGEIQISWKGKRAEPGNEE